MSRYTTFSTLGTHRDAPRFWAEGRRLADLGFAPGESLNVETTARGLILTPGIGENSVSYRRAAGGTRPVIDLNSRTMFAHMAGIEEVKLSGTFKRLELLPTLRAAAILRARSLSTFRVLDIFAGGGTLSDALCDPFRVVAGIEISPDYADEFCAKHPEAEIVLGDFRRMHVNELPEFDGIVAGIPCSEHSNQGRAKKSLAGIPELGELGDLYIPVLALVAARLPAFCLFENVPLFGTSLAGRTMVANLQRLGYHVTETVIDANGQWGEPTTRNRWVCVATLRAGFAVVAPNISFEGTVGQYFDAPDAVTDRADAERIAVTVAGLRVHNKRHADQGHGFAMKVLDGTETAAPVICKSYHKINSSGFFIATEYGPRMVRKSEIERLQGQRIMTDHYATAVQMMGQGVLGRVFSNIFRQLATFLS